MLNLGLLRTVVFIGLLLIASCTRHDPPQSDEIGREAALGAENAIRELSKRWLTLWRAGDADGVIALLDDDVVFLPRHNHPLIGPEAVKSFINEKDGWKDDLWAPTSVLIAPTLDVAVERGVFKKVTQEGGINAVGNYVTVYHLVKGEWKIQSDAKWMTDAVIGDTLCRVKSDGSGGHICRKQP